MITYAQFVKRLHNSYVFPDLYKEKGSLFRQTPFFLFVYCEQINTATYPVLY